MNLSDIYYEGSLGLSAANAAAALLPNAHSPRDLGTLLADRLDSAMTRFAVFLSAPRLSVLERIGAAAHAVPWMAAFPFERHLVVTPLFTPGAACARCFVRRWISQPPDGYQHETVHAIVGLLRDNPHVEYRNPSPLAASLAARLLIDGLRRSSPNATCFDTAGASLQSAPIRPLHGCSCRALSIAHADRFARFGESFNDLLRKPSAASAFATQVSRP